MTALERAVESLRGNDGQWEAFSREGHTVVLAPPGSGKTQLLTIRTAYDLTQSPRGPRGAACITMTNEAALELSRRIDRLGFERRPNFFVGTVHSFAMQRIIRPFALASGDSNLANCRIASAAEAQQLLRTLHSQSQLRSESFANIEATVNRARQRMDLSGDPRLGGPRIAALARDYSAALRSSQQLDFIEMVSCAVELVEKHDWVRRSLEAWFPRVYVDEYQDLAPGLDRIVRAMTVDSPDQASTLFAVGDPDQSVYGFSGAHPELLRSLAVHGQVSTTRLKINYRSDQQVIDSALRALGCHREILGETSGGIIRLHTAPGGVSAQSALCAELVIRGINSGVEPRQIAVLAAWNSDREAAREALQTAGVACYSRSKMGWRSTTATLTVERLAAWSLSGESSGVSLGSLLDSLDELATKPVTHAGRVATLGVLQGVRASEPAAGFVDGIMSAVLEGHEDSPDILDSSLAEMLAGLKSNNMTVGDLADLASVADRVLISTIHSAKGLEFDQVVIVGLDEQVFPGWNAEPADVEESRRLLYVAITRARHAVDLVCTDRRWSRRTKKFYAVKPSPFLGQLS